METRESERKGARAEAEPAIFFFRVFHRKPPLEEKPKKKLARVHSPPKRQSHAPLATARSTRQKRSITARAECAEERGIASQGVGVGGGVFLLFFFEKRQRPSMTKKVGNNDFEFERTSCFYFFFLPLSRRRSRWCALVFSFFFLQCFLSFALSLSFLSTLSTFLQGKKHEKNLLSQLCTVPFPPSIYLFCFSCFSNERRGSRDHGTIS